MDLNGNQWVRFPYEVCAGDSVRPQYLYAVGGYHSADTGCLPWGSNAPARIRFIGDVLGHLEVRYGDGSADVFPLVLGHGVWLHSIWAEKPAPFFGDGADETMIRCLQDALCVRGGREGAPVGVVRFRLAGKNVVSVCVKAEPGKDGCVVFTGGYLSDGMVRMLTGGETEIDTEDPFFAAHTIDREDPYPKSVRRDLEKICHGLHTFEEDYANAPEVYPGKNVPIHFFGTRLAEIATGMVDRNMDNLTARTDGDGFIHTSYKDAPSWRYDGFGPYVEKANSYYDAFYARDGARAILSLNGYGHVDQADAACAFANRWMMYYPQNRLTIAGREVPGHFSVMVNQPLVYSTFLSPKAGWPTRYTEAAFGEGHENIGNPETDGHGLMMMAVYQVWRSRGRDPEWVRKNYGYIREAAKWITWSFENPDISFAKDGLLYGETEAAMNTYTLYSNLPCYLGMLGYAEMAESIREQADADAWRKAADTLRAGLNGFALTDGWDSKRFGFYHDPMPTMLADMYGYDTDDMPRDWLALSQRTYASDRANAAARGFIGATGIGYDHCMITQNAMLLDQMEDGGRFMEALCRISYAPRLPEPYLVPEAVASDWRRGVIRRQGDLGNLVQLAEAMKCCLIAMGISPADGDTLKIMPRLPKNWGVEVHDFTPAGTGVKVSMKVEPVRGDAQTAEVKVTGACKKVRFRFGPFPAYMETAHVTLNGTTKEMPLTLSGDSGWCWMEI